jgi:hypothetical protein
VDRGDSRLEAPAVVTQDDDFDALEGVADLAIIRV